jgi:hypothetical protein
MNQADYFKIIKQLPFSEQEVIKLIVSAILGLSIYAYLWDKIMPLLAALNKVWLLLLTEGTEKLARKKIKKKKTDKTQKGIHVSEVQ